MTEKQKRYDSAYLRMALEWAKLSHCQRKKVGALIVKDRMIISDGYNGCPSGFENECEDAEGNTNGMCYMPRLMLFPKQQALHTTAKELPVPYYVAL